jgi:signal peptidase I
MRGARKEAAAMRWSPVRRGSYARKERAKNGAWSTARFILTLVILACALRSFVFAPFSIPSGSMLPTLYIGDYLVVAKRPY